MIHTSLGFLTGFSETLSGTANKDTNTMNGNCFCHHEYNQEGEIFKNKETHLSSILRKTFLKVSTFF